MERVDLVQFNCTLDSTHDSIDIAESAVVTLARRAGLTRRSSADIGLAVREIFANAVMHGNRWDSSKKVSLEIRRSETEMAIVVSDEGNGFDPSLVPNPLSPEGLLRPSGRGLLMVRTLVDEFHVQPGNVSGTKATLVKYIRSNKRIRVA